MKTYKVYFEIYGKKLKIDIKANSLSEAMAKVKDSIIFHKIVPVDDDLQHLKDFFGF